MKVAAACLAIFLVASLARAAPLDEDDASVPFFDLDEFLEGVGITPDMTPEDIELRVNEVAENLKEFLDNMTGLLTSVGDDKRWEAIMASSIALADDLEDFSELDTKEEVKTAMWILFEQFKEWCGDVLVQLGVETSSPAVAQLLQKLDESFTAELTAIEEESADLSQEDFVQRVEDAALTVGSNINMVLAWLGMIDFSVFELFVAQIKADIDSRVSGTAGLTYDELKAEIEPLVEMVNGAIARGIF